MFGRFVRGGDGKPSVWSGVLCGRLAWLGQPLRLGTSVGCGSVAAEIAGLLAMHMSACIETRAKQQLVKHSTNRPRFTPQAPISSVHVTMTSLIFH